MDFAFQAAVIVPAFAVSLIAFRLFLSEFPVKPKFSLILLVPMPVFSLGFMMRLSEVPWLVDAGYFYTDFSFLLIYSVFSAAFLLGQIKYWKK